MAGDTAAALGLAGEFEWRGRRWKVSPVTLKIEGLFSFDLTRRARLLAAQARSEGDWQTYEDLLRVVAADIAAYEYEWTGRICRQATQTPGGQRDLAFYCILEHQPDFTRAQMDALFADAAAWDEVRALLKHHAAIPKNGPAPSAEGAAA